MAGGALGRLSTRHRGDFWYMIGCMSLTDGDKKWIKDAIVEGVVDGINQVMIPYSEEQEKRFNHKFEDVDKQFEVVRNDIAKLEKKLDSVTDHQAKSWMIMGGELASWSWLRSSFLLEFVK